MKGLDNNEEAKNLVENFKGSTENRMRSLYNLGYWQGFNDGQREAVQMLERALMDMTAEQTEPNCSEIPNNCEPKICDACRYYNSNIPCGSTPSACKEADKFAEEFVDGLKKLKPKDEPQTDGYISGEDFLKIFDKPQTEREGE